MKKEITNSEILKEIKNLSIDIKDIKKGLHAHDEFFTSLKETLDTIESKMATKVQVKELISVLHDNKIITSYETNKVNAAA